jgi:pimeloyl-ACP methyl ester carboxylesterase
MAFSGTEIYEHLMRGLLMADGARSCRVGFPSGVVHALELDGDGISPPIVLLHGFSASGASQYRGMVRRLRSHVARFVIPDLPGHGLSTVPAVFDGDAMLSGLDAVFDRMIDLPAVVFASSMAGGLAVRYAAAKPERVAGLMLCAPGGAPVPSAERDSFLRPFNIRSHGEALGFVDRLFPRHPRRGQLGWDSLRQAYAWGVRQQFNRPHLVDLLRRLRDDDFLRPDEVGALKMPVHVVWGELDEVLPRSHGEFYRRHLPRHATFELAPFGHAPFLDEPDAICSILLRFIRTLRRVNGHALLDRTSVPR